MSVTDNANTIAAAAVAKNIPSDRVKRSCDHPKLTRSRCLDCKPIVHLLELPIHRDGINPITVKPSAQVNLTNCLQNQRSNGR